VDPEQNSMTDLLPVLALGATTLGLGAAALAIAAALGLHRRWFGPRAPWSAPEAIDRLVFLAEVAKSEGLLVAESRVDAAAEPILARGLSLAAEGATSEQIASELNELVDAAGGTSSRPRILSFFSHAGGVGAAALLAIILAYKFEPERTPPSLAMAGVLGFLALAATGAFASGRRSALGNAAGRALAGTMQAVAASLIASGCDGASLRGHLSALLPPSQRGRVPMAEAA
jgi:hypothetical protein